VYVRRIYNVSVYTLYANNVYNRCVNDRLVTYMSDTPAKRQAYSFAFPPDKKQAFTKIADEKYQRPASWLLLQAIDQVIANGGLLGEETSPALKASPPLVHIDIDEASKVYASKADLSDVLSEYVQKDIFEDLQADVADLRSQFGELKTDNDMTAASIKRLIAEAISKASIGTTGQPNQKAKPATTANSGQSAQEAEVQKWVRRLEANPELRAAIEEGLSQNLTGKALTEWVFSKGFGANENTKAFDSSVTARMRGAIEYLNGGTANRGESNV
jgi:hypothetical protein